jgi:hypothetical protein
MKNILLVSLLLISAVSWADPGGANKAAVSDETGGSQMLSVRLRTGLMLSNPDHAVISKWEHQPLQSYKYALGGHAAFPPSWKQLKFLAGGEFQYITAKQELSGSYNATIDTTITQFVVFGGAQWKPYWAAGFGAEATLGLKLASQKKSKLDAEGFTQDLGDESAENSDYILLGLPLLGALHVFYDLGSFRPYLTFESDAAIALGGAYVF